jgi:Domain of unknown function (DUF5668)
MTEPIGGGGRPSPPSDWRQREGARRAIDTGTVIWGLILIAVGGWFLLDHTLGFDMPDIDWGDLWPVILIVIGGGVILQGISRRRA